MNQSKISVRYSKAIFLLAKENKILNEIFSDFRMIRDAVNDNPGFTAVITSPIIKPSEKIKLFSTVFGSITHEMTMKFLDMLVDNSREAYLIDIIRNFEELYRKEFNIKQVILTTPEGLTDTINSKITDVFANTYNAEVEIIDKSNPNMLGGIIVRIENQQLDLSVATQLKEIKKTLKTDYYVKKI